MDRTQAIVFELEMASSRADRVDSGELARFHRLVLLEVSSKTLVDRIGVPIGVCLAFVVKQVVEKRPVIPVDE